MYRTWLTGTALAAVLAAAPALAQDPNPCDLSADTANLATIDANGNGEIAHEEFLACLEANVDPDRREPLLIQFDDNANDDDVVVIAAGGADSATADAAQAPEVAVSQPAAEVEVEQPAPSVRVDQAGPEVEVEQARPQVAVSQQAPEVQVEQAQPEVSVRQPEPTVEVEQPEAQVSIQQAQPRVEIDAPPPEVEVTQAKPNVTVNQYKPQVSVEQKDPVVSVETAEAEVQVESEEPKVVVEQAEPEVVIERVSAADANIQDAAEAPAETETALAESGDESAAPAGEPAPEQTATQTAEADGAAGQSAAAVAWPGGTPKSLEGETVVNAAGEDIGSVDEVVRESASGDLFVVVSVGGFLGIGDKDVVFPLSEVSIEDDRVVIATSLTEEALTEREEYDDSRYVEIDETEAAD